MLRVSSYSVVVDAVVTDRSNRHVRGLTKEDFVVYEDGVPQEIGYFAAIDSQVTERLEDDDSLSPLGPYSEATQVIGGPSDRLNLVIFLLDHATIEYVNQKYIRDAATRFVREEMRPNDLMAVFQVGMGLKFLQGFTNDREAVVSAMSRMDSTGSVYAVDQAQMTETAQTAQEQVATLTTNIDTLGQSGGYASMSIAALIEYLNQQMMQIQQIEGTQNAQLSFSREQQSRPVIGAIETIARGVQHIPGRKTLVLFSQGVYVPLTLERALYRAVDAANKANLAIYAIDGAGLEVKGVKLESELHDVSAAVSGDRVKAYGGLSLFDRAREVGSGQRDSSLRYLASSTGGLLIRHTNDFFDALSRVEQDLRTHYVLSYIPLNRDFDGRYRSLKVEVKRPGVNVRARSGYWAIPPGASVLSAEEYQELLRGQARVQDRGRLDLYSQLTHYLGPDKQYRVNLSLELPFGELSPVLQNDERWVDLDVLGLVQRNDGEVVSSFRGPSRLKMDDEQLDGARSVRLEAQVDLLPGSYAISILVSNPVSGKAAFQQRSLRLARIDDALSMSSLVLGRADEMIPVRAPDFFTVDNVRVTPSASRRFSNGEELIFLLDVYNPGTNGTDEAELELEVTLLRGSQPVRETRELSRGRVETDPLPHLKLARYLELEGLPTGTYFLRTTVRDHITEDVETTQTAFHIE